MCLLSLYNPRRRLLDMHFSPPLEELFIIGIVGMAQHGLGSVKCGKLDAYRQYNTQSDQELLSLSVRSKDAQARVKITDASCAVLLPCCMLTILCLRTLRQCNPGHVGCQTHMSTYAVRHARHIIARGHDIASDEQQANIATCRHQPAHAKPAPLFGRFLRAFGKKPLYNPGTPSLWSMFCKAWRAPRAPALCS